MKAEEMAPAISIFILNASSFSLQPSSLLFYGILADISALLHGLVVLYITGGFLAVLAGLWRRWAFVRRLWFRFSHLALCLFVAAFEAVNQPCPLTTLEHWLREPRGLGAGGAYEGSFIAHYVHQAIHLPVQPRLLAVPMFVFAALVVALYLWRGPLPAHRRRSPDPTDEPPRRRENE